MESEKKTLRNFAPNHKLDLIDKAHEVLLSSLSIPHQANLLSLGTCGNLKFRRRYLA
jgi:hypothetical protein